MLRKILFFATAITLGVSSCTPKVGVLRSPDYSSTSPGVKKVPESETVNTGAVKSKFDLKNIALLLPFQLNQVAQGTVVDKDVKRSALALDFYQGFELGLEELSKKGASFNLDVLDTRDNVAHVAKLAASKNLDKASIVVGPVYPQEIKSFGTSFTDKEVLQINPLAAAMPTEFNLSNLVSLTPPIKVHSSAVATRVAKDFSVGDVIIVFNTNDADSRQFLNGMVTAIKQAKSSVNVVSVSTIAQLNDNLKQNGRNFVISGTTDKVQLKNLIDNLTAKYLENYYSFNLFGHPLWDRFDFSPYENFSNLTPVITSESHLRPYTKTVKDFVENYNSSFGINPSDASYKGYDAAIYFGGLIGKYGAGNLRNNLTKDSFSGVYSSYKFNHNEVWGYVNEAVFYKVYRAGGFQLQ